MDFVIVASELEMDAHELGCGFPEHRHVDFVLPAPAYDADLGMARPDQVKRQLRLDVPRSEVVVNDVPTACWRSVYRTALYPRMCTQAVLAPIVEWVLQRGLCAYELPGPLRVSVTPTMTRVTKRLGLTPIGEPGEPRRGRVLFVDMAITADWVVASCTVHG